MRKTLLTIGLILLSVAFIYGTADALVSGVCSDCHTMHNSQGGSDMVTNTSDNSVPQPYLTMSSCLGCHSSGGVTAAPKIDGDGGIGMTAGGDYDLGTADQRHNLVGGETYMAPPGYTGSLDWDTSSEVVSCEGAYGCHGTHGGTPTVKGLHHAGSPPYRFLYAQTGNTGADGTPVNGLGSSTWEKGGALSTDHNVYDGDGTNSISSLCANCHGNFHGSTNTNAASPFKRHPTDGEAVIATIVTSSFTPTDAELDETPFAFTDAEISLGMSTEDMITGTAYTTDNGKAMCLSCHRAHGTDQNDLLRFNYATMNAGDGTNNAGCETCHVNQR